MSGIGLIAVIIVALIVYFSNARNNGARKESVVELLAADYDLRVTLPRNSGWGPWSRLKTDASAAEIGALREKHSAFLVIPVFRNGMHSPEDLSSAALLAMMDFTLAEPGDASPQRIQRFGMNGIELRRDRKNDQGSTFKYRIQILHSDRFSYLLAAWIDSSFLQFEKDTFAILDHVHIEARNHEFAMPSSAGTGARHARWHNEMGLLQYRHGNFNEAADHFEQAFGHSAELVHLSNLLSTLFQLQQFEKARAFLDSNAEIFRDRVEILGYRAHIEMNAGNADGACDIFARLFEQGSRSMEHLQRYTALLWNLNRKDEAFRVVEGFLKAGAIPEAQLLAASMHSREQQYERALELIREVRAAYPNHIEASYELADCEFKAGNAEASLDICEQMLAGRNQSAIVYYLKGRAEYALGRLKEARSSLEEAAKRNPADNEIHSLLEHVVAVLGQSNSLSFRIPIEPVSLPDDFDLNEEELADFNRGEQGAHYLDCAKVIHVGPEMRMTEYLILRTTTAAGVALYSTFLIPVDPFTESVFVNQIEVQKADGTIVTGQAESFYILDDRNDSMATTRKILHIPVPGLSPGATMRLTFTRRYNGKIENIPFHMHMFSARVPTQRSSLFLTGDLEHLRIRFSPADSARRVERQGWIGRIYESPPRFVAEPNMKNPTSFLPLAWIGDAKASWEELSLDYLKKLETLMQPLERMQTLASSLLQDSFSNRQKIDAVLEYIQSTIRYTAIEFGTRGQIPDSVTDILTSAYGDCKDHSLLALHLLRAVGLKPHLALVHTANDIVQELPSLDQFNHMILYVEDEDLFVDPVQSGSLPDVPVGLANRHALILHPERPFLKKVPQYSLDSSRIRVRRKVLADRNLAKMEESVEISGYFAGFIRPPLQQAPPESRALMLQELVGGQVHLQLSGIDHLEKPRSPLLLHTSCTSHVGGRNGELQFAIVAPFEQSYLRFMPVSNRKTPFEIPFPLLLESKIEVTLEDGLLFTEVPQDRSAEHDFLKWSLAASQESNTLTIQFHCHLFAIEGLPERYNDFQSQTEAALKALQSEIRLKAVTD